MIKSKLTLAIILLLCGKIFCQPKSIRDLNDDIPIKVALLVNSGFLKCFYIEGVFTKLGDYIQFSPSVDQHIFKSLSIPTTKITTSKRRIRVFSATSLYKFKRR